MKYWPLFDLTIETPSCVLRLPTTAELAKLAQVAADGVHHPDEQPFLTPWTSGTAEDRARFVLQHQWSSLGSWSPDRWSIGFGVFVDDLPVGVVNLRASDFLVVGEVATSSWLGLPSHGKGIGTHARAGVLALAFDHLGAAAARSDVFQDNHASQAVSRKLGYVHDGITRDRRGDEVLISDRLRLTSERWKQHQPFDVTVTGFAACRPMFGLD